MTKTGKIKAAVAGATLAATVAAASVGGGSPTPAPSSAAWTDTAPGSVVWSDAVTDLQSAVNSLMSVSADHGVELPDKPGINDLVDGLDGVSPVDGYTTYATTTSTGAVGKGDPVRYALEPNATIYSPQSIGLVNCTLLAMSSGGEDWTNSTLTDPYSPRNLNSAYVYTSTNGNTGIKVVNKNGYSAYATLCAGEANSADVYCNFDNYILVAWSAGGVGMFRIYKVNTQSGYITLTKTLETIWAETGAPDNVHMTYDSMDDRVSILCTKADEAGARYGAVFDVDFNWTYDAVASVTEIKLTADVWPELRGMSPDAGAKGWDIASGYHKTGLVTCPTTTGGQAVVWIVWDESGAAEVKGYILSKFKGGIDATLAWVVCEGGPETFLLARTVKENGTNRVSLELLWERIPDGKPAIVRWGHVPGSESIGDMDQLRICNNLWMSPYISQSGASMVSWVTDGGLYAATVELAPVGAMRRSPAARVTDTDHVGTIMERSGGTAKVVYAADEVREGYVRLSRRVSSCEASEADGYALADARAGASIQFMRSKTW